MPWETFDFPAIVRDIPTAMTGQPGPTADCSGQGLPRIPNGLPSSTNTLDFSFNYLPAIYNTTFVRLKELVSLDPTRCKINCIFKDVLHHQADLETLILIANQLMFLSDDALAGPQSLKHLSLTQKSTDDLKFLPRMNLNSLETLDLGDNDIDSLHDLNQFNWQKMTINLPMNSLQNISAAEVAVLKKASLLNVSFKGNSIVYIKPNSFESCHFNSLDFSDCLSEGDISMTSLTHLILNQISFKDLCQTNAASLPQLTVLSVRGNQAQQLTFGMDFKESCLRNAIKLELLDWSHSRLLTDGAQCCEVQLAGLGQLHKLNLSYNVPATSMKWGDMPFNETSGLIELDCSNLKVTRVAHTAAGGPLRNLGQLRMLNISWKFGDFSVQWNLLEGLKSLEHLNLRGSSFKDGVVSNAINQIEMVDVDSVKALTENSKIDLSGNPLTCNCSNIQLIGWIQSNANKAC
ncbi:CD180 antigen [Coregonus clupeaformis]|uniref:CD180 antigen n=1 Tax=Coregonus clupeaformis TaxID=59861 RepID=UPI001E1C7A96|nr:CD180 antigen [Coregonus clupeaformis]